jgi:hypothetical protein
LSRRRRQRTRTFPLRAALALAQLQAATGRAEAKRAVLAPALADIDTGRRLPEFAQTQG